MACKMYGLLLMDELAKDLLLLRDYIKQKDRTAVGNLRPIDLLHIDIKPVTILDWEVAISQYLDN